MIEPLTKEISYLSTVKSIYNKNRFYNGLSITLYRTIPAGGF